MASVMSAILLTAAIIGLGYSCESQSQINSYSQGVQQTGAKGTEAQRCRGTPVHASAPSASHNGLPHSRCCEAHWYIRRNTPGERGFSSNMPGYNQTDLRTKGFISCANCYIQLANTFVITFPRSNLLFPLLSNALTNYTSFTMSHQIGKQDFSLLQQILHYTELISHRTGPSPIVVSTITIGSPLCRRPTWPWSPP